MSARGAIAVAACCCAAAAVVLASASLVALLGRPHVYVTYD